MTAREPEDRPLPAEAADELTAIANGGQATMALAAPTVAAPTLAAPRVDRTQVMSQTRVAPAPSSRPVAVARPRRGPWPWVLGLLAAAALVGAGATYASQQGETGPLPRVDTDIPPPLRDRLEQLQAEVDREG